MTVVAAVDAEPSSGGERILARVVPGAIFAVLFWVEVERFLGQLHGRASVTQLVGRGLYMVFVGLFMVLTAVRPPALAIDRRVLPFLASVVGTFGLVVSPLLFSGTEIRLFWLGRVGGGVQAVLALVSIVGALVSLTALGTAFSLTPQARHLVVRGPYRLVRHPLYFFEALAMIGAMLASGSVAAVVATSAVLAAQLVRIHFEEILLARVFPDYHERFRGVRHLVPGIY